MSTIESVASRILVPVEKAELLGAVFETLGELARELPLSIELLQIWEPLPFTPPEASYFTDGHLASYRESAEAQAHSELRRAKELAEAAGIQVDREVIESGHPAEAIVSVAEERKVDWIAIASHQRRGASRWFLGSVAERVVASATQPVLVVPARE